MGIPNRKTISNSKSYCREKRWLREIKEKQGSPLIVFFLRLIVSLNLKNPHRLFLFTFDAKTKQREFHLTANIGETKRQFIYLTYRKWALVLCHLYRIYIFPKFFSQHKSFIEIRSFIGQQILTEALIGGAFQL